MTCDANPTEEPSTRVLTSVTTDTLVKAGYQCSCIPYALDGYPICFSWPVLPSSIAAEHVEYERTDGLWFDL